DDPCASPPRTPAPAQQHRWASPGPGGSGAPRSWLVPRVLCFALVGPQNAPNCLAVALPHSPGTPPTSSSRPVPRAPRTRRGAKGGCVAQRNETPVQYSNPPDFFARKNGSALYGRRGVSPERGWQAGRQEATPAPGDPTTVPRRCEPGTTSACFPLTPSA